MRCLDAIRAVLGLLVVCGLGLGCSKEVSPKSGDGSGPTGPVFGDPSTPTDGPMGGDGDGPTPGPGPDGPTGPTGPEPTTDVDAGKPGPTEPCDDLDRVVIEPTSLPECDLCENARCVPESTVMDEEQRALLAPCDGGGLCVPDKLVAGGGNFKLASCRSTAGVEGRCVSRCVPRVAEQAERLPQDTCDDDELCAPCFDPVTGEDTGSCGQSCDPGPAEDKVVFDGCCGELSVCVPQDLVPEDSRGQLDQGDCSESAQLCVPRKQAEDPEFVPLTCVSLAGAEGRCLPACLPAVAAQADRLPKAICDDGELCAPCYDPISGAATGACEQGGDMPKDPPTTFAGCCDDGGGNTLGTCVPESLVPSEQVALLGKDTCTGATDLCAPTPLADGSYTPTGCTAVGDSEGRCLPACLPDVAARSGELEQDVCAAGNLCVPCYDPLSGESTGACSLADDEPVDPPSTFEGCCDDGASGKLGACVPLALVPAEQVSLLGQDTCSDSGALCAPTDIATGTYAPTTCRSWENAEGRCLPACLPDVAARAGSLTKDSCGQGKLCVPCYDPITGESTGACTLEGDAPTEAPVAFPTCCDDGSGTNDLGICVPTPAVPAEQVALLGADVCTGSALCAPMEVAAGTYTPKVCQSWLSAEGRCLPACLPPVADQAARLTQDNCDQGELCVPCFDPLTGDSTGACGLEGDAPANTTPTKFPTCCPTDGSDRGTCVPKAVAGAQGDIAPKLNCDDDTGTMGEYICAPNEKIADESYAFPTCKTAVSCNGNGACLLAFLLINNQDGACVPACMLAEQPTQTGGIKPVEIYGKGTCATGEACAPCEYPALAGGGETGLCPPSG